MLQICVGHIVPLNSEAKLKQIKILDKFDQSYSKQAYDRWGLKGSSNEFDWI